MTRPVPGAPTGAPLRRARALVVAGAAVVLAAGGHLLGGGSPPGLAPLLAGAGLVYVAADVLARRRLPLPLILALLTTAQVLLHGLFTAGPAGAGDPHGAIHAAGHAGGPAESLTLAMIVGHLLATAVTAVVLARGEAAVWVIWSFLARRVRLTAPIYRVPRRAVPQPVPVRLRRSGRARPYDADRRGPPARALSP